MTQLKQKKDDLMTKPLGMLAKLERHLRATHLALRQP
jgi:hypothetical protein